MKKCRGPRQLIGGDFGKASVRLRYRISGNECFDLRRPEYRPTKFGRAGQVVLHAMPRRERAGHCELPLRIGDRRIVALPGIGKAEFLAQEPFL